VKQHVKTLIGQCLFGSGLNAALIADAAVVVAFHRVKDGTSPEDSLTTNVAMFERYCHFFRRHFRVVPLPDLIRRMETGRGLRGYLAITFDDGYRDNYECAAPVLERLSLPATFFVVTDWLGTKAVAWWDEAFGAPHPWMTWDEVRSLHRRGFDIGAHTRTHVDLGAVTGALAREEIAGSRAKLEAELQAPIETFAYPYGRRGNITDANRALVKAAGFRCCCSSYGGVNPRGMDPFRLHRVPISPSFASPSQLGLDVALGRSYVSE
jgi:peptidoglycan/xylan/chitin deacetylase (PgdA/CDA1 family)